MACDSDVPEKRVVSDGAKGDDLHALCRVAFELAATPHSPRGRGVRFHAEPATALQCWSE